MHPVCQGNACLLFFNTALLFINLPIQDALLCVHHFSFPLISTMRIIAYKNHYNISYALIKAKTYTEEKP